MHLYFVLLLTKSMSSSSSFINVIVSLQTCENKRHNTPVKYLFEHNVVTYGKWQCNDLQLKLQQIYVLSNVHPHWISGG